MRANIKIALWFASSVGLLVLASVLAFPLFQGGDPFDRVKLLNVIGDGPGQRYAAIYRYDHANSSATVTAIWILPQQPPATEEGLPSGAPAVVWTGGPEGLGARWAGTEKLIVDLPSVSKRSHRPDGCYFMDDPRPADAICFDPKKVEVRVAR